MRKIIQGFASSRYIKNFSRFNKNICPINSTNFSGKVCKKPFSLTYRPQYNITNEAGFEVKNKLVVPYKGYLKIRNS